MGVVASSEQRLHDLLELDPVVACQQAIAVVYHYQDVLAVQFGSYALQTVVEGSFGRANSFEYLVVEALEQAIDSLAACHLSIQDAVLKLRTEVHVSGQLPHKSALADARYPLYGDEAVRVQRSHDFMHNFMPIDEILHFAGDVSTVNRPACEISELAISSHG